MLNLILNQSVIFYKYFYIKIIIKNILLIVLSVF